MEFPDRLHRYWFDHSAMVDLLDEDIGRPDYLYESATSTAV